MYPDGGRVRDNEGMIPLHLALATRGLRRCAHILIDSVPETAAIRDVSGRLPIHMALQTYGAASTLHSKLIDAFPESLEVPCPATGLLPYLLAGTCRGITVSSIYDMLRRAPHVLLTDSRDEERLARRLDDPIYKEKCVSELHLARAHWQHKLSMDELAEKKRAILRQLELEMERVSQRHKVAMDDLLDKKRILERKLVQNYRQNRGRRNGRGGH